MEDPTELEQILNIKPGDSINSYQLDELISNDGHFAQIWSVSKSNKQLAMKIFYEGSAEDDEYNNEVRILSYLNDLPTRSPYLSYCHEIFTSDQHKCLLFDKELMSLDGFIMKQQMESKGPFITDLNTIKSIARSILKGMEFLHDNNIVHLDIKPRNILINASHEIKIIDFGSSLLDVTEYESNRYYGTTIYMAPEIICKQFCSPLSDIFSFCVTMFDVMFGRSIFDPGEYTYSYSDDESDTGSVKEMSDIEDSDADSDDSDDGDDSGEDGDVESITSSLSDTDSNISQLNTEGWNNVEDDKPAYLVLLYRILGETSRKYMDILEKIFHDINEISKVSLIDVINMNFPMISQDNHAADEVKLFVDFVECGLIWEADQRLSARMLLNHAWLA